MFKSVFFKYITAFVLIIVVSFTLLSFIMSAIVVQYSDNLQQSQLQRAADVLSRTVSHQLEESGYPGLPQLFRYRQEQMEQAISVLTRFSGEMFALVTDVNGVIIGTDHPDGRLYLGKTIPAEYISAILSDHTFRTVSTDLSGLLPRKQMTTGLIIAEDGDIRSGEALGTIIVCSTQTNVEIVDLVVKTMIMSSLWVLLAAMIAAYFISERFVAPIRKMSVAARQFATGQFDVRVPVTGHDEVSELAVAFNNMADSLSNLEKLRSTFLANVSHDLRTPMTTIAGFIDGILDGAIPPEQYEHYLGIIATEVRRLSRLVGSLLDISRIQAGDRKFNMAPFDICEMARLILISLEQRIDAKKLDVVFECDEDKIFVIADHDAIYQVLYNIADNAVKFASEGGRYEMHLRTKDRKVYVSVYNEGQGIPAEDLPYVFDRFYKSDKSRGLDKSGVGLGLYITKTIMDAHKEKIWVNSAHGKDCEFTFTLPHTHEPIPAEQVE